MQVNPEDAAKRLHASPIRSLLDQFCAAPFRLAPEFEVDLQRILGIKQVKIVPTTDTAGIMFCAHPDGRIDVGIRSLERLWAFCWIFAAMQREKERVGGGREISLAAATKQLLYWAHKSATDELLPYPQGGPIPDSTSQGLQMKLAIEFFLGASGAILFHELAHILKPGELPYRAIEDPGGRNKAYNHSIEFGADKLAYDYIFTEWKKYSHDGRVFTKRVVLFGIVFTFLIADAAFAGKSPESHTHPSPFRRLAQFMKCLEKEFPQEKEKTDAGLLWIANFVYAITATLWKDRVLAIEFSNPQAVLSACERVFVPAKL
jgi:hypothetical protein